MSKGRNDPHAPSEGSAVDSFMRQAAVFTEPSYGDVASLVPLQAGEVVGDRFRIEGLAGSGGMASIYRAADVATGLHAAVKVIGRQSGTGRERFMREAAVLAQLSHPYIVRYLAHGITTHGLPFLAMDWLEGEDLAARLGRSGLGVDESLTLIRRAAEGLAVAHDCGVVHRDIKPSNLFLVHGEPASVKVIDFGVAHIDAGAGALTRSGALLGTVSYMAPEQVTEAANIDARADVYALGCVLFECLTGRPPFVGRSPSLVARILREKAPRPSELRAHLDADIDALIERMLAKQRSERPRDAAELLRALDGLDVTG
jgi:serine/threonine protein kinase